MPNEKPPELPSFTPKKPEIPAKKPDEIPPIDIPEKPESDGQGVEEPVLPLHYPERPALSNGEPNGKKG